MGLEGAPVTVPPAPAPLMPATGPTTPVAAPSLPIGPPIVRPRSQLWWALWRLENIAAVLVLFSSQIAGWFANFNNRPLMFVVSQSLSGVAILALVLGQLIQPNPPNAGTS